jgi:hypothetical protein
MEAGMASKDLNYSQSLDSSVARIASLLFWWGSPEIESLKNISDQLEQMQRVFLAIQDACASSSRRHAEALASLNELITGALAEIAGNHEPASWIEIEGRLFDAVSERLNAIADIWVELANEVNDRAWSITNAGNSEPPNREVNKPVSTSPSRPRIRGNGSSAPDCGEGRTRKSGERSGRSAEIEQ